MAARREQKPIVTECPFGERVLKEKLEKYGLTVLPYFVVEPPEVCAKRYMKREGKPIQKAAYTRATSIVNRAIEWNAPMGNSDTILAILKNK